MKIFSRYLSSILVIGALCSLNNLSADSNISPSYDDTTSLSAAIGVLGGYNFKHDTSITTFAHYIDTTAPANPAVSTYNNELAGDLNFGFSGLIGYKMEKYLFEASVLYSKSNPGLSSNNNSNTNNNEFLANSSFHTVINAGMIFPTGFSKFSPLVGLGIGLDTSLVDFNGYNYTGSTAFGTLSGDWSNTFANNASSEEKKSKWKVAAPIWQVFVGAEMDISETQCSVFARLVLSSTFSNTKWLSRTDEKINVSYKPTKAMALFGVKFNF